MRDAVNKATGGLGPESNSNEISTNGDLQSSYEVDPGKVRDGLTPELECRGLRSDEASATLLKGNARQGAKPAIKPAEGSDPVRTRWKELSEHVVRGILESARWSRLDVRKKPEGVDFIDARRGLIVTVSHDDAERIVDVLSTDLLERSLSDLDSATAQVLEALRSFN